MGKILVTGDTYLGDHNEGETSPLSPFNDLLPYIKASNVSITNLEAPVSFAKGPISKVGPALYHSPAAIETVAQAGFTLVTLANNHIMDFGVEGLQATMSECNRTGLHYTGAGMNNRIASSTYFCSINGIRIGVVNIAENEFSTTDGELPGANPLNPIHNFAQIREAKKAANHVLVIVHGGHEMYQLPSPRMKSVYRFFVECGADAVVGHHTHCFSGYEMYKGVPIFYSLGNLIFKWQGIREESWYEGYAVLFTLNESSLAFQIIPYCQSKASASLTLLNSLECEVFENRIKDLNAFINDDGLLHSAFKKYCKATEKSYKTYLEPHSNRLLRALQTRNVLPSFISKRKKMLLLNLIRCEAHRDVILDLLENEISDTPQQRFI